MRHSSMARNGSESVENILSGSKGSTKQTLFGKVKRLSRLSLIEKSFLVVSLLILLGIMAFTSYVIYHASLDKTNSGDLIYAIIILINSAFCGFYVLNGVFREKVYDMIILIISLSIVWIYCIVDFSTSSKSRGDAVKITRFVLINVGGVVSIPLAVTVIRRFGFFTFGIVGPSEEMQKMYNRLHLFFSLLKLDLQLSVSCVLLIVLDGPDYPEIIGLTVGLVAVAVWAAVGWIAARHEKHAIMWCFEVLGLLVYGYIAWRFYTLSTMDRSTVTTTVLPASTTAELLANTTTVLPANITTSLPTATTLLAGDKGVIATIIAGIAYSISHLILLVAGVLTFRNFDRGLKEIVSKKDRGLLENMGVD